MQTFLAQTTNILFLRSRVDCLLVVSPFTPFSFVFIYVLTLNRLSKEPDRNS